MKLNLMVADGVNKGKLIPITRTQFPVGRDASCHLRPASPAVSKRHCAVLVREGKVFVRDLKSTNGTLLNDQPIDGEVEVQDGDKLQIGPLNLVIRIERRTAETAPAPAKASKPRSRGHTVDEDSVADMLLEMDEQESSQEAEGAEEDIPGGSTVFEVPAAAAEETKTEEEPAKPSKYEAVKAEQAGTSAAAQEILRRYARKTR